MSARSSPRFELVARACQAEAREASEVWELRKTDSAIRPNRPCSPTCSPVELTRVVTMAPRPLTKLLLIADLRIALEMVVENPDQLSRKSAVRNVRRT
jgi:hypothetical protein